MTDLRASDAEREAAAQRLARHHADGRLDTDELQERLDRAYAATTRAELARLEDDLPREEPRPAPATRGFPLPALPLIVALAVASAVVHAPLILLALPLLFAARRRRGLGPGGGVPPLRQRGWGPGGRRYTALSSPQSSTAAPR